MRLKTAVFGACALYVFVMIASVVLSQPDVTPPVVDPPPPWYAAFAVFLIPVLNLLGKALLMTKFVPNKLIPGINAVVAMLANYYGILGWDSVAPFGVAAAGMAGLMASAVLGMVQSAGASWFYEWQRKKATKLGIWFERGKRSVYDL